MKEDLELDLPSIEIDLALGPGYQGNNSKIHGECKPIHFASRFLNSAELKRTTNDLARYSKFSVDQIFIIAAEISVFFFVRSLDKIKDLHSFRRRK